MDKFVGSQIKDPIAFIEGLGLMVVMTMGNEAYIRCPFHVDSRPSLCVSLNAPIFYCQSCQRGGHLSVLKRMMDDKDFGEDSIEDILQGKKHEKGQPKSIQEEEKRAITVLAKMNIEDYDSLPAAEDGKYFRERGIRLDTICDWGIRRTSLFLVFPVFDSKKVMTGLVLRTLVSAIEPRYQNQPKGFMRNCNLFGIHKFKRNGHRFVILVEGPSDVIKMHQESFTNTVGVFGSSMKNTQIDLLRRLGNDVFLLMDNESSGKEATVRIGDQLTDFNVFIPDYNLYRSKDPGEASYDELSVILDSPVPYLKARLDGVFSNSDKPKFRFRK